mmetsp:Transcript_5484/g.7532  ORF Transcript_5484/g.7532 Transcript_5484/m.7532 type:complete len:191 (-) Transcript_5484:333-905(-)
MRSNTRDVVVLIFFLSLCISPVLSLISAGNNGVFQSTRRCLKTLSSLQIPYHSYNKILLGSFELNAWPADKEDDDFGIEFEQGLEIFKKKSGEWKEVKVDNRDALPYTVYCATPPRTKLGTFRLDPLLSPGDRMSYKEKSYIIKKVRNKYKFRGGKFRMFAKEADATELSRSFTEQVLTNLLDKSGDEKN